MKANRVTGKGLLFLSLFVVTNLLFSGNAFGQIIAYDFNGNAGTETTDNSTTTNANLSTSTISKGLGLSNPAGVNAFTGSFGAVGYSTGTTSLASSITALEYIQFTIKANAGFVVSLSTLDATFLRSTNNAPNTFQWQYSLDGFGTAGVSIGSPITYSLFSSGGSATNGSAQAQINLSAITALQNVGSATTITIRLYGWGANNIGSTFAIGKLTGNDLAVGGSVASACTPPAAPGITTPVNLCLNGLSSPLTATGTAFKWYTVPTGGSGSSTAPTPSTIAIGNTIYYVSQTTGCEGPRAAITVIVNSLPIASVSDRSNISCFNANNGMITVQASAGSAPYTFSVDNGTSWHPPTSPTTISLFNGLSANNPYRIRVKDNNQCVSK